MKKGKIFLIIIAIILVGIGVALIVVGYKNRPNVATEEKTYVVDESFNNINFDIQTADLKFEKATDDKVKLVCVENAYVTNEIKVENNTLKVTSKENRKWYEFLYFNFTKYKITLYLKEEVYDNLNTVSSTGDIEIPNNFTFNNVKMELSTGKINLNAKVLDKLNMSASTGKITVNNVSLKEAEIKASTGDIKLSNMNVSNDLKINTSTGDVELNNVNAKNIEIKTSTGDMELIKTIAIEHMELSASTGHIHFDEADAKTIKAKTSTGKVYGVLNTPKTFYATSDTGKISVPKTTGGECEITTHTGSITITIKE